MLEKVRLGKTGLMVTRIAMGCIPIQRLTHDDAIKLVRKAYDNGVNFFDTANAYTDSEEKLGAAFAGGVRQHVIIATKSMSTTYEKTAEHIDESLRRLRTDYVDLCQWHNPHTIDNFLEERGPYHALLDAQKAGKIRHIGITNHHLGRARAAVASGVFATVQFPFSVLSSQEEIDFAHECAHTHDMGFIAMKAMCGGLLDDGRLPFAFMHQYPHVVPIWGLEKEAELDQFISLARKPEAFTDAMQAEINALRAEYGDAFCRGCGYCLPCPSAINIPIMMRILLFIKRNPAGSQFSAERLADVDRIEQCITCRACVERCPYHLEVPDMLQQQLQGYRQLHAQWQANRS